MLNIVIATDMPSDCATPKGGVEAVSVNLVTHLAKIKNIHLDVVTFDSSIGSDSVSEHGRVRFHRLRRETGSLLSFALGEGKRRIQSYIQTLGADIVHAHDTYGLMTADLGVPRVFTVHGFIHGDIAVSNAPARRLRSSLWKYFETRGWAQQPNVISISPYVRERLSRYSDARIFDIDNPISEAMFDTDRATVKYRVFSAAVICRRKNTLQLVKAMEIIARQLQGAQLVLAGHVTEPDYGEEVQAYILSHGLADNVRLIGAVSTEEVRRELAHAAVFALVSLEENSPMGIEEAMAVGVPVVTSNRCGMPYMVRHGVHGYLTDPLCAKTIASHVLRILTDDSAAHGMSVAAKETAMRRFHPSVVAARTIEVYREILETQRNVS